MICKHCDSVIEDNATTCPYCLNPVNAGGNIDGGNIGWDVPPAPVPQPQPKGPNLVIGIITGILGLGFLVEAFLYFVVLTP